MSTDLDNDLYADLMADDAPEQEPEQKEPEEQVEEEGAKEETATPPVDAQEPAAKDERLIPINALLDEREKRQRLEAELAEYKAKAQPAKEAITEDDLFSNPEQVLRAIEERAIATATARTINMMEAQFVRAVPDAPEKFAAFKEAAMNNPVLLSQFNQSGDPVQFAYETGKKILNINSMPTDMANYEKELRAKIETELAAKYSQKPASKMPSSIPTTLSDVPNTKPGKDDGDFDFDSLFAT